MKNSFEQIKTPSVEGLSKAFQLIAYSSLKENNEPLNIENIETEASRIERCIEHFYVIDKTVKLDYPQFASKFLQENFKKIVFGNDFLGSYLECMPDGVEKQSYFDECSILM